MVKNLNAEWVRAPTTVCIGCDLHMLVIYIYMSNPYNGLGHARLDLLLSPETTVDGKLETDWFD